MSAALFYLPFPAAFTSNGLPAAGAKAYFYLTGTTTLATVYADEALTIPRTNPVVADGAGRLPQVYLNNAQTLRVDITDSAGALLTSVDPYVPGTIAGTVIGSGGVVVATRAELATIVGTTDVAVGLTESGREGTFFWDGSNLSAKVTLDVYQAIYVASSTDTTGASGAWVRQFDGPIYATWAGFANGASSNAARLESLIGLLDSTRGNWIVLPSGQVTMDRQVDISLPVKIQGYGRGTGNSGSNTSSGNTLLIFPAGYTGFRIHGGGQQSEISEMRIAASGVLSTTSTATYSTGSASTLSSLGTPANFANKQVVALEGAGPSLLIPDRTAAITSGNNVATITNLVASIGNPGVYIGQPITIAGAGAAAADLVGFVGSWTSTTISVVNAAGAVLNAGTTVTAATYIVKLPLVDEIASGGGTATLTIGSPSFNYQNVTGGNLRHAAPGIMSSTQFTMRNVEVMGFQIGMFLHGTAYGEVADMCSFYNCLFNCTWAGVVAEGYDAQVNFFYACDFSGCLVGLLDNSFLGNEFFGCHWAFNVGIMVGSATSPVKIIGGYFESGTSYVAPANSDCVFYGTTSMLPGSGWAGFYGYGGILNTGGLSGTQGQFSDGLSAVGRSTWLGGNINSQAAGATARGWRAGNDPGGGNWLVSYAVANGAYDVAHIEGTEVKAGSTFGASDLGRLQTTGATFPAFFSNSIASGYVTGAGGAVTQATSRTTGVTLNKACGSITLVSAAGSASYQTFTVTNSTVAATDTVRVVQKSGTDKNMIHVTAVAAGSFDITFATTGGTTTEQPVFNFSVLKGVNA